MEKQEEERGVRANLSWCRTLRTHQDELSKGQDGRTHPDQSVDDGTKPGSRT